MKVYVASSWRNPDQPAVVEALRRAGHEVYDFKNPKPGDHGFQWRQVPGAPPATLEQRREWEPGVLRRVLTHEIAQAGFRSDFAAMQWADAFVLVLPCGRSAHLEAGWATGAGKPVFVFQLHPEEPELMYLLTDGLLHDTTELLNALGRKEATVEEAAVLRVGRCTSCKADIRWAVTERGKAIPLDDTSESAGNIWIEIPADPRESPIAHVVTKDKPAPDGHALWTSHFATCPDSKVHRREPQKRK